MINEFTTKAKKIQTKDKTEPQHYYSLFFVFCFFQLSGVKNAQQRFWCALAKQQKRKRCMLIQRKWLKPITLATIDAGKITINHAFNVFLLCHSETQQNGGSQIINSSGTFTSFI